MNTDPQQSSERRQYSILSFVHSLVSCQIRTDDLQDQARQGKMKIYGKGEEGFLEERTQIVSSLVDLVTFTVESVRNGELLLEEKDREQLSAFKTTLEARSAGEWAKLDRSMVDAGFVSLIPLLAKISHDYEVHVNVRYGNDDPKTTNAGNLAGWLRTICLEATLAPKHREYEEHDFDENPIQPDLMSRNMKQKDFLLQSYSEYYQEAVNEQEAGIAPTE